MWPHPYGPIQRTLVPMTDELYIVNKSGGLIYSTNQERDYNYQMILTSSVQSLSEITRNCLPTEGHVQTVLYQTKAFAIFKTLSNLVFIFAGDSDMLDTIDKVYKSVYLHFCEFVLSDPFYKLDMPVKNSKFQPKNYLQGNKQC